jgi:agmatinase
MRNHKIRLQGILYDEKSSYMRGPALAPPLIRKAYNSDSTNYFSESGLELRPDIWDDKGDYEVVDYFDIEKNTNRNLDTNQPLITLGGDHSITYPILKAITHLHGPVNILHIDAHSDLYNEFEGDKYSHACPFARIMEEELVSRLVQVGVRTLSTHQKEQAEKFGVEILAMKDFDIDSIPNFNEPIYLSLDIDALDPAFAPGVSHHEPGGFSTRQVLQIIQKIKVPIIGADIVEYNPKRDINGVTAMVCAKFLKEIAAKIIENKI